MDLNWAEIRARLKQIRTSSQLKQIHFAAMLGVNSSHVSKTERGLTKPSMQYLKAVCKAFNLNEEWLLRGVGEKLTSQGKKLLKWQEELSEQAIEERAFISNNLDSHMSNKLNKDINNYANIIGSLTISLYNYVENLENQSFEYTYEGDMLDKKKTILEGLRFIEELMNKIFSMGIQKDS